MGDLTFQKTNKVDYKEYNNLYNTKYIGLETTAEIMERVFRGLDNIKAKYSKKNVLIVTHSPVTRCIKAYFNGLYKDSYERETPLKNCEIIEYEF